MVKIIATDIDGTFLRSDKTFDRPRFEGLLGKMAEHQIEFVVASGNQHCHLLQHFADYQDRISFVSENGGHVIVKGKTLLEEFISKEAISKLVTYMEFNYPEAVINLAGKQSSYLPQSTNSIARKELEYYLPKLIYVNNLHPIPDDDFFKMTLLVPDELTEHIQAEINEQFMVYGLSATTSGFGCLDIIPTHMDKSVGLQVLLDYWQCGSNQLMAFGDGGNDIEMLRLAGQSYAMANAPLLVQNEAKYLAPSNDDDGVLSVLEAFLTEED